jgi:hypothetical protein
LPRRWWADSEIDWLGQFRPARCAEKLAYVEQAVADFGRQETLLNNGGNT